MLKIRKVKHLADATGFSVSRLHELMETADDFCQELIVVDPVKPGKNRTVLDVRGDLRRFQDVLLRRVLMQKLSPSPFSHGGIRGRNIKSNIQEHIESVYALTADISNFYPSVSHDRVYRMFTQKFECTPDVARVCTRLCTFRHHLALGLVTSPFLADQTLITTDARIARACRKVNLIYTRYVDDICISGPFKLDESGFGNLVGQILMEHGFTMHPGKLKAGRLDGGATMTKLVVRRGHPDVRTEYLDELVRQIEDAGELAKDHEFIGPYFTRSQIRGRVNFVCWINPGRRRQLGSAFKSVAWAKAAEVAKARGLVATKKHLVHPDFVEVSGPPTTASGP